MEYSNIFVCCMGLGLTFIVLICIIILCKLMSIVCNLGKKNQPTTKAASTAADVAMQPIENKQQLVAAICAVIAEELGTEVKNLKVVSFRRL